MLKVIAVSYNADYTIDDVASSMYGNIIDVIELALIRIGDIDQNIATINQNTKNSLIEAINLVGSDCFSHPTVVDVVKKLTQTSP